MEQQERNQQDSGLSPQDSQSSANPQQTIQAVHANDPRQTEQTEDNFTLPIRKIDARVEMSFTENSADNLFRSAPLP